MARAAHNQDVVPGHYVRMMIGLHATTRQKTYRVCEVVGLGAHRSEYKVDGVPTTKSLHVRFSRHERTFKFERVSNSRIQTQEQVSC